MFASVGLRQLFRWFSGILDGLLAVKAVGMGIGGAWIGAEAATVFGLAFFVVETLAGGHGTEFHRKVV